ncbi:MAG: MCP four helix bundle domain-containing protein, partial [Blastocatellia bacterium]
MESLRRKLALSYGPLIVILIVVSAWGVYNLVRLGRAVDVILVDNYKSIQAASLMKQALERQNASALLYIAGYKQEGIDQFKA